MTDKIALEVNELFKSIVREGAVPDLDETTEICISMICQQTGRDKAEVCRMLKRKEAMGELVSHVAKWNGARVKAYSKPGDAKKKI